MRILAIDLGKRRAVACDYNSITGKHEYQKVPMSPKAIHDLFVLHSPDRIVLEVSPTAGWVYDIGTALGIEIQVANANHDAWRWKNVKRKDDKTDALKLAQLSIMNQLPTVHMPEKKVRQKRSLIRYRQKLIKRRTQVKNNIRSILDREGLSMPKGQTAWTKSYFQKLKELSIPLTQAEPENLWRGQLWIELEMLNSINTCLQEVEDKLDDQAASDECIKRLRTCAGVGPRLAEAIVAFLDNPKRFKNSKQVGSYVGLTPRQYQSGQMNRQGKISCQGNKLLRSLLVEVSWMTLQYNPWARSTYQRILRNSPSRKKVAIVAVARKLLIRCWVMLRDEQPWQNGDKSRKNFAA